MISILLNITFYFNISQLKFYNYNILIHNLIKFNISYRSIFVYLKNILKQTMFNIKNKYNSIKSKNKHSKTYYSSSHNVKKGLVWFGFRTLKINSYSILYLKLLISTIFNLRSNLSIISLEYIKFLYYIKSLQNFRINKLLLNNLTSSNYILNNTNNKVLLNFKKNNIINIIY